MTELESGTPVTETPAESVTESPQESFSFFSDDGSLTDNWKEGLPEDIRGEKTLDTFTDFPGAVKMLVSSQKMIGRDKVARPTTEDEWNNFYNEFGRPESADGYQMEVPEPLQDYYAQSLVEESRTELHKLGLSQDQYAGVMALDQKRIQAMIDAKESQERIESDEAEAAIDRMQGAALPQRLHLANRFIEENTNPELKEQTLAAINNSHLKPLILDMLANAESKFVSHNISEVPIEGTGMTPGEADAKMKEMMETKGYATGEMKRDNPAEYARITKECQRLAAIAAA